MLNYIGYNEQNKFALSLKINRCGQIINKENYKPYAEYLMKICQIFTKQEKNVFEGLEPMVFADHKQAQKLIFPRPKGTRFLRVYRQENKFKIIICGFLKISFKYPKP